LNFSSRWVKLIAVQMTSRKPTDSLPGIGKVAGHNISWHEHLPAFLSYVMVAVAVTWPVAIYPRTRVITRLLEVMDAGNQIWFYWFVKDSVLNGRSFFHTDYIFYPIGKDVVLQVGNYLEALISIPFQLALGFPAFYNVFTLLILALNGYCAWLLIREMTGSWAASWPMGLFYAVNPYIGREIFLGQTQQAMIFWFPLYLLFLHRLLQRPARRDALWAGVILALTCATYWFYGIFLMVLTLMVGIPALGRRSGIAGEKRGDAIRMLFWALGAFAVVVAPFAWYFVSYYFTHQGFPGVSGRAPLASSTLGHSMDLDYPLFFCPVLTWLAILPLLFRGKQPTPWPWLAALGLFFAWSLGPFLRWEGGLLDLGGQVVSGPFLWAYRHLPLFSRFHWPDRILPIVFLILIFLGGNNLGRILARIRARGWRAILGAVVTVLIIGQWLLPYPRYYHLSFPWPTDRVPEVSPFYHWLAGQPPGAIIELPLWHVQGATLLQMVHHHKMLGGIREADLVAPAYRDFVADNSLLRYFSSLFPFDSPPKGRAFLESDRDRLRQLGFRYVILQKRSCAEKPPIRVGAALSPVDLVEYRWIREELTRTLGPPVYTDHYLSAFVL